MRRIQLVGVECSQTQHTRPWLDLVPRMATRMAKDVACQGSVGWGEAPDLSDDSDTNPRDRAAAAASVVSPGAGPRPPPASIEARPPVWLAFKCVCPAQHVLTWVWHAPPVHLLLLVDSHGCCRLPIQEAPLHRGFLRRTGPARVLQYAVHAYMNHRNNPIFSTFSLTAPEVHRP